MTYTNRIELPKSLHDVWKLYSHPENMYSWQPMLKSYYKVDEKDIDAKRVYENEDGRVEYEQKIIAHEPEHKLEFLLKAPQETIHITDVFSEESGQTIWQRTTRKSRNGVFANLQLSFKKGTHQQRTQEQMELFKNVLLDQ